MKLSRLCIFNSNNTFLYIMKFGHVVFKITLVSSSIGTKCTWKWLFSSMHTNMNLHVSSQFGLLWAKWTCIYAHTKFYWFHLQKKYWELFKICKKNYYQMNILIKCICKQIKLSDKKQHSKLKVYNIKPFIVENLMDMQIY